MSVRVVIPGALTTVQDSGRYGYQQFGIGTSGVMDQDAFRAANNLVGNESGEAVLEATLFGGSMECTDTVVMAITGADMEPECEGKEIPMNAPFLLEKGDVLELGMAKSGCRSYLAFAGGIDVPVVMGSRSTNMKCQMGGYQGRPLKAGDELAIGLEGAAARKRMEQVKERREKASDYPSVITVRAVDGPQAEYFTEKGRKTFYGESYTISGQSDRMGYRLEGAAIESVDGTDIISDGIALGSVQVPASGKPIVLLADRQTTGGYAKIATVCSFDIPRLAQGKPGDQVRFQHITIEEAQKINQTENHTRG